MPKKNVNDLITDQEMAYARLLLSGTMADRCAAEAVGLDPNSNFRRDSAPVRLGLGHGWVHWKCRVGQD